MRRKPLKADMGEALSFDSILTVLTVLFVLRMIFLIPMVNVDKAKLDQARHDSLWIRAACRLERSGASDPSIAPYASVFSLQGGRSVLERGADGLVLLSSSASDSTLTFVEHDPASGRFSSLRVQRSSEHPVFRRGTLLWSPSENAWFATSDTTDYGEDSSSASFLARIRQREAAR